MKFYKIAIRLTHYFELSQSHCSQGLVSIKTLQAYKQSFKLKLPFDFATSNTM